MITDDDSGRTGDSSSPGPVTTSHEGRSLPAGPALSVGLPFAEGLAAPWFLRVVAALLDQSLLMGVTYLAFPVQPVAAPGYLPWSSTPGEPVAGTWTQSGWVVATVVVVLLMQAYLGSTPGKLFVGLAVVREADARPAGLLRTLGRALAHILDSIFLIGYLRPLWNRRRQTFADSLARTVVIVTRRPLPLVVRSPRAATGTPVAWEATIGHPVAWEAPTAPRWRAVSTYAAGAVCLAGVGFALGPTMSSSPRALSESCSTVVTPADAEAEADADAEAFTLLGGQLMVDPGTMAERRLGVERQHLVREPGISVTWDWSGTLPPDPVRLRVVLARADGTAEVVIDHEAVDGLVQPGRGVPLTDGSLGVLLPLDTIDGLGDGWTWSLTTTAAGETSPACTSDPSQRADV